MCYDGGNDLGWYRWSCDKDEYDVLLLFFDVLLLEAKASS